MALQQWALPRLSELLPLDEGELQQILSYTETLPDSEVASHLGDLLGGSRESSQFIASYCIRRDELQGGGPLPPQTNGDEKSAAGPTYPPSSIGKSNVGSRDDVKPDFPTNMGDASGSNVNGSQQQSSDSKDGLPPPYVAAPAGPQANSHATQAYSHHSNVVVEAGKVRARDEQEMQQMLQTLQYQYRIYNSDIEPEHETDYPCSCPIHIYKSKKWRRFGVQEMWSKAVLYPGQKPYYDNSTPRPQLFNRNPYIWRVVSPYGYNAGMWAYARPKPAYHAQAIHQTISLNNSLNQEAQASIDAMEPKHSIWDEDGVSTALAKLQLDEKKRPAGKVSDEKTRYPDDKKRYSIASSADAGSSTAEASSERPKASKLSKFRKSIGIMSSDERAVSKVEKAVGKGNDLRGEILAEEAGRWPDQQWRDIVANYQAKVGMTNKIAHLRAHAPIQYLHLLRAGFFEPIPVAWANQASNPLKFSIEAASGWPGLTPTWRGYEDTAEERLYWVLNHREGSVGMRMKPDYISEMNMARARMATAVEPPPMYFSSSDTCHLQHTSEGYSKQVMPPPFKAFDRPEVPTDDSMILLDVSGSMDFDPVRPVYDQYLITGYAPSTQPKNKDVAKAIIRRFVDAMANHDHQFRGYDLVTFANKSDYIGSVHHKNLDTMWRNVRLGGGTRVMTGWQRVKELHFQKHSESATHHPIYGWQAGPETPMLRLLLLLDGEATDMDEFELDLLGLSWAHVTIFLIGVDGCPHHHRHANELQRISDVNHHVSFVDAQGNVPERFVTHELLKRHLGYDLGIQEFEQMEELPAYEE